MSRTAVIGKLAAGSNLPPDVTAADGARSIHLALVNRGCLIAPFHNMMLVSPATKKKQVDLLVDAFGEICGELAGE